MCEHFFGFVWQRIERSFYMDGFYGTWHVVFFLFCPCWLYFFSAATCMRARILCQWFGRMTAVNIYWVKNHYPYALQTFVDPSNKNYVHKKIFSMYDYREFSQLVNTSHSISTIINIPAGNFLTLVQEQTRNGKNLSCCFWYTNA